MCDIFAYNSYGVPVMYIIFKINVGFLSFLK